MTSRLLAPLTILVCATALVISSGLPSTLLYRSYRMPTAAGLQDAFANGCTMQNAGEAITLRCPIWVSL